MKKIYGKFYGIIRIIREFQLMSTSKSEQSRFLGDLPMTGEISEKERIRYISHLMFFFGCGILSFGVWALTGFNAASSSGGPFPLG